MTHVKIIKTLPHKQGGFTLIEMLVGLAIIGLLLPGITTFMLLSMNVIDDTKDHMQATMQVENAGYWMSRDIQMSENFTLGENAGFPLQLAWSDIDQNEYEVTYSLNENSFTRSLIINEGSPVQTLIAQNINTEASLTNITDSGGMMLFSITSTSGDAGETRTYKIKSRLELIDLDL